MRRRSSRRRLESPLDSFLELTDAAGRRIAFDDDHEDKAAGTLTHHADSLLTATLPATETYFLRVGDVQHKGGGEYAYRLHVGTPRPDFDLRITPSTINVPGGGTVPVTVYALRKGGFEGEIALALQNAPSGFALTGATIPAGTERLRLTLTAPPITVRPADTRPASAFSEPPVALAIEGRATIEGRTIAKLAAPSEDMMQAFAYRHLVAADVLRVCITSRGATRMASKVLAAGPIRIPAGGTIQVRVSLPPGYRTFDKVAFDLSDPPDGMTVRSDATREDITSFVLVADASKVKPGARGNLVVTVSGERVPPDKPRAPRRIPLGTLPAIPSEVVTAR